MEQEGETLTLHRTSSSMDLGLMVREKGRFERAGKYYVTQT
jgi:hypothetical protein